MAKHEKFQPIPSFETHPDRYRHWKLQVEGSVATLTLDIQETEGLRPDDYLLKLNSYDLGVDLELADAIERLRFEHPAVSALVITSGQAKVFCAGANIKMLSSSTHAFKVNFCRFTNETRCNLEDASARSGIHSIAALNGTASGGGYELAEACDSIYLIDDGASAVSLPEVPLLGVLPGTGGLTRLVDKRGVRRDIADLFCTKAEGFRARDAVRFGLVDGSFARSKWEEGVRKVATEAASRGARGERGVSLTPLQVEVGDDGARRYSHVSLTFEADHRVARLVLRAPQEAPAPLEAAGASAWAIAVWRELDDALLHLRFNHEPVGLVLLQTEGDAATLLAHDHALQTGTSWLHKEARLYRARVLRRLDNTARSFFALVQPGSCFVGSFLELVLAADRSYMLNDGEVSVQVGAASAGSCPMSTGLTRLQARFPRSPEAVARALAAEGPLDAEAAFELGLVTMIPDDIDWDDEIRIAIEERISLSPDALTGMEQNLRFVGSEGCDTKIFGRLSAWQNWIFQRPNAVGDEGALTLYGHPSRPKFDWRRT
jgi:benzoyl-CoA-dihydrodiol lyase